MPQTNNYIITQQTTEENRDMLVFARKMSLSNIEENVADDSTVPYKGQEDKVQEAVVYVKMLPTGEQPSAPPTKYGAVTAETHFICNMVVADFLEAPDIEKIDLSAYTGNAKDRIIIKMAAQSKAGKITVTIKKADNSLTETGSALFNETTKEWEYKVAFANVNSTGLKVIIRAC